MRIHAGQRKTIPSWDQETGIWSERPEPVQTWILRTLEFIRAAHFEYDPRPLEELEVVVSYDTYREVVTGVDYLDKTARSEIFGATFTVDSHLPVPFEVRWISREEQALQSLVNRL